MADLNDSIDIDVYRQLNTILFSFNGFTESGIISANGHSDIDLSGKLHSSFSSSDGFSHSYGSSNLDDVNASVSQVSSDLEYDNSENESQDKVESNYNSDYLVTENESDEEINHPENNDKSDNYNFDSSSSVDESEENIVYSDDTDSDSIENRRENVDLDGVANKHGTPDELFDLLNQPINWKSNNFNNIEIKHFRGTTEAKLSPNWDSDNSQPLDYFQLYFNDEILRTIVENSNIYHHHCVQIRQIRDPNYRQELGKHRPK